MMKDSNKVVHHFPILTIVGRDSRKCGTVIEPLTTSLAEKSIDTVVIYTHKNSGAVKGEVSTICTSSHDTIFLNGEFSTGDLSEKGDKRLNILLSQYCLSYDLIILCTIDNNAGEEIHILEWNNQSGKGPFRFRVDDNPGILIEGIYDWLCKQILAIPVWGCVLIGGKSSRMGRPKHLIEDEDGITWGEKTVRLLSDFTEGIVLSGTGEIPQSLTHCERLVDIAGASGPISGILAAMRWNPRATFVVAACDMPGIQQDSLRWLLGRRRPGVWGTVPRHPQSQQFEPLLAHYDYRSRMLFEQLLDQGSLRPNHICQSEKIETPVIPLCVADSWHNCNTPEDLSK